MPVPLTAADWTLSTPLFWLTGAAVLVLVLDALRPARLAEGLVALLGLAGAAWSCLPLLREPVTAGFAGAGGAGPMLRATPALAALALLCLGSAFVAGALGWRRLARYEAGRHSTAFWSLLLFCPAGMLLTLWADHMAILFLGIETLSLPLYVLAALQRQDDESVEAGIKYFLLGAFASGFLAFGMALVYAGTGRMDPGALSGEPGTLAVLGAGMLLIALLFKAAIAPFHLWVADVYQGSPTPVTALMAAGTKAAAVAALFRWAPGPSVLPPTAWAVLGTLTLVVGNWSALNQSNLKRLLALSGVAHAGLLLYAFAANAARYGGSADAPPYGSPGQSLTFYLLAYGFAALAAFGAVEMLERHTGTSDEELIRGLARRHPLLGGVLCIAILSLAGFPFTAGFLAKYFIFSELVRAGMTGWALAGVLLTLVAFAYYLKVLVSLFMREPGRERPEGMPVDNLALAVLLVPALLSVVFGVWPAPLLKYS